MYGYAEHDPGATSWEPASGVAHTEALEQIRQARQGSAPSSASASRGGSDESHICAYCGKRWGNQSKLLIHERVLSKKMSQDTQYTLVSHMCYNVVFAYGVVVC